ncbi:hypothetical protein GCM10027298_37400 [Epidermidibacterium keratini]
MRRLARRCGVSAITLVSVITLTFGLLTLLTVAAPVPQEAEAAQNPTTCNPISIQNGSFEQPAQTANVVIQSQTLVPGWSTTATDGQIEIWRYNNGTNFPNPGSVPAAEGRQFAELNANQTSTLYQDIATVPGQVMRWSLKHRGRLGADTMQVQIGAPGGTLVAQTPTGATSTNITDGNTAWGTYSGIYVVPAGQTTTRFAFAAVSTSSGNTSVGNFLDDIVFANSPCMITDKSVANLSSTDGSTLVGDILEYTVTTRNGGGDASQNTYMTDPIPAGTEYVPGSMTVDGATLTDASGDDRGAVGSGQVRVNLGSGATATAGGSIPAGGSSTVKFRVRVTDAALGQTITNTATVNYNWSPVSTTNQVSTSNDVVSPTVQRAGISLTKSVASTSPGADGRLNVGDTITYSFRVTNTGTVALSGVSISDPRVTNVSCPTTTLAAGASTTCTGTMTVTQADVDSGSAKNTASASGTPAGHQPVTSTPSSTTTPLDQTASLSLTKAATGNPGANGRYDVGDIVTYTFTVTNTGSRTISGVRIVDPLPGMSAPTCQTTTLGQGQSTTCTSTYSLTQADIDRGTVANTATATGVSGSTSVNSNPSSATVSVAGQPSITVAKTHSALPASVTVGTVITYSFVVTNNGSVTLNNVAVSDPKVGAVTCPTTTLAPNASVTCTKTYTVTQADVDAGAVNNTATASGTSPSGQAVSATASDQVLITANPQKQSGTVVDTNGNGRVDAGDTINYVLTARNAGNVTLTNVRVTDPGAQTISCPTTRLAPGESVTCQATRTLTQADVNAGQVVNTATVTGTPPTGGAVSAQATATTTISRTQSLSVDKTVAGIADTNNDGRQSAGDVVTFNFVITNTGTVTVSNITVTDPLTGAPTCTPTTLEPGVSATCTQRTYTLTQADINRGSVTNTVTVNGTASGQPVTASDAEVVNLTRVNAIDLTKSAGALNDADNNGPDAGDTITYTFTITNTGNTTLTSVALRDPKFGGALTCGSTTLAPGATATCTATYSVTQADVDAGVATNTATVSAVAPGNTTVTDDSTVNVQIEPAPRLSLSKTAGQIVDANANGRQDAGDTITYSFSVTNTGNVTISNATISDPKIGGPVTCPTPIAPGTTVTCSTATYTLTQADINAGRVVNTATVTGTSPQGTSVTATGTATATITPVRSIDIDKQSGAVTDVDGNGHDVGDTIAYTFVVTNTGTVTISAITITDPKVGPVTCQTTSLAPGASTTCGPVTYTLTQADVNSRVVNNTASVSGTVPGTTTPVTDSDANTVNLTPRATFSFDKSAGSITDVDGNNRHSAGDSVVYTFTFTNTGAVTVSNPSVTDPKIGTVACPPGTIAPGASVTCTRTYVLTQADVNAGQIVNTATGSVLGPDGAALPTQTDSNTLQLTRTPSLDIQKESQGVVDANATGSDDPGDTITYTFTVVNTGNVTLTSVTVTDSKFGGAVPGCAPADLAPGARITCTATYTITPADFDDGTSTVTNTASVTGTDPTGTSVTDAATVQTPLNVDEGILLIKTAGTPVDVDGSQTIDAGDTITYNFTVRNVGDTTLSNVTVTDPMLGGAVCTIASLSENSEFECEPRTYTLTQADVDAGTVTNPASVSSTNPAGDPVTDQDETNTVIPAEPGISMTKTASGPEDTNGDGGDSAGDEMSYTITVTNTGNVTLDPVTVNDELIADIGCPQTSLAPGVTMTCTAATYVLTQADIDAGSVTNSASATGTPPGVTDPVTFTASITTELDPAASLLLDKQVLRVIDQTGDGPSAGDQIEYSFELQNTGAVTITSPSVIDEMVGTVTCPEGPLAPGQVITCTAAPYTITQQDVDAGTVENTATARGLLPDGGAINSNADATTTAVAGTGLVEMTKTAGDVVDANGDGRVTAGDTIDYTITVRNTGTSTIDDVVVNDPLLSSEPLTCSGTSIPVGGQITCGAFTYTLTQADIDAGVVENDADMTGTVRSGGFVEAGASASTPIEQSPSIAIDKQASAIVDTNSSGRQDAGDTITYTFVVQNTGTTTLRGVTVNDPKVGPVNCPPTDVAPGSGITCTVTYTITQQDVNNGTVDNTATASATDAGGTVVTSTPDSTSTVITRQSSITIDKAAVGNTTIDLNGNGQVDAGDAIDYTFTLTNTGTSTLRNVAVSDPKIAPSATTIICPRTALQPGTNMVCTARYILTQGDIDARQVLNTASVASTDPTGAAITDSSDEVVVSYVPQSSLALTKSHGDIDDLDGNGPDAGDEVVYTFTVTNNGATTVDGVSITDETISDEPITCTPASLAPGASATCTATYTLDQDDLDAATLVNDATATGVSAVGPVTSPIATDTLEIPRNPAMELRKADGPVTDTNGDGLIGEGDQITYTFTVTNIGNQTITDVAISDPKIANVTCPDTPVAPGDSTTCTATYTLTLADANAGTVYNIASVSGTDPSGTTGTFDTDDATATIPASPGLSADKQAGPVVDANGDGRQSAGDTITYTFVIANTGNVTIDLIDVIDAKLPNITCPVTVLDPKQSTSCTETYTITQTDLDSGSVGNTGFVTGETPGGTVIVSPPDSTSTTVSPTASISLTKTAGTITDVNGNGMADEGDTVTYSFSVTNTGAVTIRNPQVFDSRFGTSAIPCDRQTLEPGQTVTCSPRTYTLTLDDVNAGTLTNTASAIGQQPDGTAVFTQDTETIAIAPQPSLEMDKQAAPVTDTNANGRVDAGDQITYTFVVSNTGNVTVDLIEIDDPKIGSAPCQVTVINPGASTTCTANYTITQADLDAGSITNRGSAIGTQPNDGYIRSNYDETSTNLPAAPAIEVTKSTGALVDVDGSGGPSAGDTLDYTIRVANTGTVTVSNIVVDDPLLGGTIACPTTSIAPNGAIDCGPATYTLTQDDLDNGAVLNTATASGTAPNGAPVQDDGQLTTEFEQSPGLSLVKEASAPADANTDGELSAGDEITYTFTVTNTGNVTVDEIAIDDPLLGEAADCPVTSLLPGDATTCTATYTITQADMDAGVVDNVAFVTGQDTNSQPVTSNEDSTTTALEGNGGLAVDKTAGQLVDVDQSGTPSAGDTIDYTIAVTNTGTLTASGIVVTDPLLGEAALVCSDATIPPGGTITCGPFTYTLTQADVNSGAVTNTATASGQVPGETVDGIGTHEQPLPRTPGLSIDKTAGDVVDANGDGATDEGDQITYTFVVTNTGNVTLNGVVIDDPKVGAVTCPATTVEAGTSMTCSVTYTLTQADLDAGEVTNQATVSGIDPTGASITSLPDSTTTTLTQVGTLDVSKSAGALRDVDGSNTATEGDEIDYTVTVTNTGTVTVTGITVNDPLLGGELTCGATDLAPGESLTCGPTTYTITQADIDAGQRENTATATGDLPNGTDATGSDTITTPIDRNPSLGFEKTAGSVADANGSGKTDAGDTITYTFTVTNTGNVTVSGVQINDSRVTATCPITTVTVGDSIDCTGTYTITQADMDAGTVDNSANAVGTGPSGNEIPTAPDTTSTPLVGNGGLDVEKTAGALVDVDGSGGPSEGDTIDYSISVTNTGTVTASNIVVNDPMLGGQVSCGATSIAPGATIDCGPATYTLTQADIDDGGITNTATATGQLPNGNPVDGIGSVEVPLAQTTGMTVDKTASAITDSDDNGPDAGDTITYTFEATNTGNVTMVLLTVDDPKVGAISCPSNSVLPGETVTCTATYLITQDDVNAGEVVNIATVTATDPNGVEVTSDPDGTTTPIERVSSATLEKTAGELVDADNSGGPSAGDTIDYTMVLTNTGNTTISNVVVTDEMLGGALTCTATTVLPGDDITCGPLTYTLTQDDVNAGGVSNTATATGQTPDGVGIDESSTVDVAVPRDPSLTLDKQASAAADTNGDGRVSAGDQITYSFVVTNNGNVTIDGIAIDDSLTDGAACPITTLQPGESTTCTATYTVTQTDLDAGSVGNTATASGTDPTDATITSPADATNTELEGNGGLDVTKSASALVDVDGSGGPSAGDTIEYAVQVANTGTVTATGIVVTDPMLGGVLTCSGATIAPEQSISCGPFTYPLTQADIDRGEIVNTATASGRLPGGGPVDGIDTVSMPLDRVSGLSLDKQASDVVDANNDGRIDAGDTITYTFVITASGNVTINGLTIDDPKIGAVACSPTTVAPGSTVTCTANYTLTQADLDAGEVINTATVSGTDPTGAGVTSPPDSTTTELPADGTLSVDKTAGAMVDVDESGGPSAGDTIDYTVTVTNSGTVTVSNVVVDDAKLGGQLSCGDTSIAPGQSITCGPVTYTINQTDVDNGVVTNVANVTGARPDGTATSGGDGVDVPLERTRSLELDKQAGPIEETNGDGRVSAGDQIDYTFVVQNTGNVTATQVAINDSRVAGVSCPVTTLLPGEATTCTATYTLSQTDLDAGVVDNSATATATDVLGEPITSNRDTTSTEVTGNGGLGVEKTAGELVDVDGSGGPSAGDTIDYSVSVTNTGTVSASNVIVSDPLLGGQLECSGTSVAPGATITCGAFTYTLTQADVDAGMVTNSASASGQLPNGDPVDGIDTVEVPLDRTSSLAVDKSAGDVVDANGTGRPDAGDTIDYTFTVTNTGNTTINGVSIDDPKIASVVCPTTTVAPGESVTCTATYIVSQADLNAGEVVNTATASGIDPTGTTITSDPDGTTTELPGESTIAMDKTAGILSDVDGSGGASAGDQIDYTITVTNTGSVTLTEVTVTDELVGALNCTFPAIDPGQTLTCGPATYTLTQDDVNAGQVTNIASVTGVDPSGEPTDADDSTTTTFDRTPSLSLDKQAGPVQDSNGDGRVNEGDEIDYSFVITNTGNVTITDVAVDDPMVGAVACPITTLQPGESTTCTATYTLTQDDVDAGVVDNAATVSGQDPAGDPVESNGSETSTPIVGNGGLDVTKSAGALVDVDGSGGLSAGDTIDYSVSVTNSGTVTATNVAVSDPLLGGELACSGGSLAPGASIDCGPFTYTLTQADIDAGEVINSATAVANLPNGDPVDGIDTVTMPLDRVGGLSLDKQAGEVVDANGDGATNAGDTITYTFVISASGNVTINGLTIDDPKIGDIACATTTVAPGSPVTCTATYTLTQDDLDAGEVVNTATVSGTDPTGAGITSPPDSTRTELPGDGTLTVTKSAGALVDVDNDGRASAGDTIDYTVTVTNAGNVTVTNIVVSDPKIGGQLSCEATSIAPGQTITCGPVTYQVSQDDVNAGAVYNTAAVTGTTPDGTPTGGESGVTTPLTQQPGLSLDKQAGVVQDSNSDGRVSAGDQIDYSFIVANTGNVTLSGIVIDDPLVGAVSCPVDTLLPGDAITCIATYTLTQTDLDAGVVDNTATATAQDPFGQPITSPPDETSTELEGNGGLGVEKTAGELVDVDGSGGPSAGDTIDYSVSVTNTGTVSASNVVVSDPLLGGQLECSGTSIAPGASIDCGPATYTLTQVDVDSGMVTNTASASGQLPNGDAVDGIDTVEVPLDRTSSLTIDKSAGDVVDANNDGAVSAGDTIDYTFEVTNSGNVTMIGVSISDPKIASVVCPTTTVAPGETVTCTATYIVSQADMNAGEVVNTATASATDPTGTTITSPPDGTTTELPGVSSVAMDKTAGQLTDVDGSGGASAGDTIDYTITVTNTGTVTLSQVAVTDELVGALNCTFAAIEPGQSVICGPATYTLTQNDVNAGEVTNNASVTGVDPSGDPTDGGDSTTTTFERQGLLGLDKQAGPVQDTNGDGTAGAGDQITYSFVITNTGNVTVTDIAVDDPLVSDVACPVTSLQPGDSVTCTATYTLTQANVDDGVVDNTATVSGQDPTGEVVTSDESTTETPIVGNGGLDVTKTAGALVDVDGSGGPSAGDTIDYSVSVTNSGTVTVGNIAVSDPLLGGTLECSGVEIAPGTSIDCGPFTYTLTQADVNAGTVINTATAAGQLPNGDPVDGISTVEVPLERTPGLSLDKQAGDPVDANGDGAIGAGDSITYTFVIANTGNVTISNVALNDPKIGAVVCPTTVEAGASVTCTATYTLTQDDLDEGDVVNSASVSGTDPTGTTVTSPPDGTTTELPSDGTLSVDKTAGALVDVDGNGRPSVGDTIDYTVTVTNAGNVTVRNVTVNDPLVGALSCTFAEVAPGQTLTCGPATYTLNQGDIDAGQVVNTATVSGLTPDGTPTDGSDSVTTPLDRTPGLAVDKQAGPIEDANDDGRVSAGDQIDYSFIVTNTGNVTISALAIDDPLVEVSCPVSSLLPGDAATCTATYTITQADMDAGTFDNTATATGTDPAGQPVTSPPDGTQTPLEGNGGLAVEKTAGELVDADGSGGPSAGDTVDYSVTVTNSGTVTASNVVVTDPLVGGQLACSGTQIAPGQSITCGPLTYELTQADIDAGSVTNTATASAQLPNGDPIDGISTAEVPFDRTSGLVVDKQASEIIDANGTGVDDAGDQIAYTFVVENTGNTTISGVVVDDPKVGAVACPSTTVLPGETLTCTVTYTITQGDVDAGTVDNSATVSGTDPTGTTVTSPPDGTSTAIDSTQAITLDKTVGRVTDVNADNLIGPGDTVRYDFTVANTGTVTLRNVTVSDPKLRVVVDCVPGTLAPGQTANCSATYVLQQADADAGQVVNTATAVGTAPSGQSVSGTDSETYIIGPAPRLSLDKQAAAPVDANASGVLDAGDTITYRFVVTNTGNVTINGIAVNDPKVGTVSCPSTSLAAGASVTCTATYTITQADVDAGTVDNSASVSGQPPTGDPVGSNGDSTSTALPPSGQLTLDKQVAGITDVNGNGALDAGDTVAYTFEITNATNVTVTDVSVNDPKVGGVTCEVSELAPGATMTCTATYTITQRDVDAGSVQNTASVTGQRPDGTSVSANDSVVTDIKGRAGVAIAKTATIADGGSVVSAGDVVNYSITVTNTGTISLLSASVSDPMLGAIDCPIDNLAPGQSVTCGPFAYSVTQADVDAGSLTNTASVSAQPVIGSPVVSSDDATVATDSASGVVLDKSAVLSDANGDGMGNAGEVVTYQFTVTNVGAVSVANLQVSDPMLAERGISIGCPSTSLAPGAAMTCTATYRITEADAKGNQLRNDATVVGVGADGDKVTSPTSSVTIPTGSDNPTPPPPPPGKPKPPPLAQTGVPAIELGTWAAILLATGLLFVFGGRRRKGDS